MAEQKEVILTTEQENIFSEVEQLVLSAVSKNCAGCSTAKFGPRRIAGAAAAGNISNEVITDIAERFAACTGLPDGLCHYPSGFHEKASDLETLETE